MTTKEFLMLYSATEEKLSELNERMMRLRSKAEKMTPAYEERIGSSGAIVNPDKIPAIVEMIIEEEQRTEECIKQLGKTRKDIEQAIFAVKDAKLSTLLMMKYMHNRSWTQISQLLGHSRYHVEYRLHEEALEMVRVPDEYVENA